MFVLISKISTRAAYTPVNVCGSCDVFVWLEVRTVWWCFHIKKPHAINMAYTCTSGYYSFTGFCVCA